MTAVGLGAAPGSVAAVDGSGLTRRVTVAPGMCGASLFPGQLGDWTWEAVTAATDTNVYDARNAEGAAAYLSFYYFTVHGNAALHPHGLTFGDVLDVTSRCFDLGSESIVTLHRLSRADGTALAEPLSAEEFYDRRRPDSLYVQNVNRWISRGRHGGNEGLVRCSPVGFRHEHLPKLGPAHSPRGPAAAGRRAGSFHADEVPGYDVVVPSFTTTHALDVVRDLNAVGLMYFASYFSLIDTAVHRLWRDIGRSDQEFVARRVVDQRVGLYGNADIGAEFTCTTRLSRSRSTPAEELVDLSVRERGTGRLLVVAALHFLLEET